MRSRTRSGKVTAVTNETQGETGVAKARTETGTSRTRAEDSRSKARTKTGSSKAGAGDSPKAGTSSEQDDTRKSSRTRRPPMKLREPKVTKSQPDVQSKPKKG